MKTFTAKPYQMISGSNEANIRKYHKYIGKSGAIWYVAIQENPADNIYCWFKDNNEGFAGQTLSFTLENGEIEKRKGPWHGNSNSLFKDTGIDITDKALTYVVIGKKRSFDKGHRTVIEDIVYQDNEPTLGKFDRYKELAKYYTNELKQDLFYYMESQGGSSSGLEKYKEEI